MEYQIILNTPLGPMTACSDGISLTGLRFNADAAAGLSVPDSPDSDNPVFQETRAWLDSYFAGRDPGFIPHLCLRGTDFQKRVWEILLSIPYGQTMTYGEVAALMGNRVSPRAAGGAVGRNPAAIIIPCHRVIGKNGRLTGYAWGLDRKRRLLDLEHAGAGFPAAGGGVL
ncbi:methylated-DNA--[protein]-cysteine S-methyltransferase [Succinimonas sp.]|uniref:methylated-DNA--[protein]-cysteine S-methyltransferase n=1 Tax=Succinimonas sp. TaxID=1936151 RepID=UPI003865785E